EARVTAAARAAEIETTGFGGSLLYEPDAIKTAGGRPFQVFTPFWRACVATGPPARPVPAPRRLRGPRVWPRSLTLTSLRLLPRIDGAAGIRACWTPGEAGGLARLRAFARRGVGGYARNRDLPAVSGVSRLSPHLHFGEISPRQAWHGATSPAADRRGIEAFR